MNYDPQFRNCQVEEELEDEEEDQKSYPKPFKRQRRNTKSLLEENVPESSQIEDQQGALTSSQAPRHPPASVLPGLSLAERSPLPLINLTAVSNSLNRVKQKFSAPETQIEVTPSFPVAPFTPLEDLSSQTLHPALNKERKSLSLMKGLELHRGPVCERDASSGTGGMHGSATEQIIELALKNEKKEVVYHGGGVVGEEEEEEEGWKLAEVQQRWQEELTEVMNDRDVCRQELEEMREDSAALEEERNRLLSRLEKVEKEKNDLSALCDQLKNQLSEFREQNQRGTEEKDVRLMTLRQNLCRLLVSFIPSLHVENVDYSSDVMDNILIQVLERIT